MDGMVESFPDIKPPTPISTIQETVDSLFTINVEGNITVYPKNGESIITGTGYIDKNPQLIYWETTVKNNHRQSEEPIIKIDRGISGKVISIVEENEPMPEFYIEGVEHPFIPHPMYLKKKVTITCQKI